MSKLLPWNVRSVEVPVLGLVLSWPRLFIENNVVVEFEVEEPMANKVRLETVSVGLAWIEKRANGEVVPIPVFTLFAPSPPKTKLLLAPTIAPAPMAVEVERLFTLASASEPRKVDEVPTVVVNPAWNPSATLNHPVVLEKPANPPMKVLSEPVVLERPEPAP